MPKFTALLFPHDALGRRMKKNDIFCIEPFGHPWTPKEVNSHEIVTLEGITKIEVMGLLEPIYDLNSYDVYNPMAFSEFKEFHPDFILAGQMKKYAEYIESEKERCSLPQEYLAKRRFKIDGKGIITKTQIYDHLRGRSVLESNGLSEIRPRIV